MGMSGIPQEVIECFLGHKQSVYVCLHDMILEELLKLYSKADFSVVYKADIKEAVKEVIRAILRSFNMEASDGQLNALLENRTSERACREVAEKLHLSIARALSSCLDKG